MLTGTVKSAFHSASADLYEPACVVERVANGIRAFGHHHFITLICARVRNGSMDFVNAGHPPGILLNGGTGVGSSRIHRADHLPGAHFFVGATDDPGRSMDAIGSSCLPDAIIEAEGESGQYGLDRLVEEVQTGPMDGNALSKKILESVQRFIVDRLIDDDLTLVIADL